MEGKNRAVYIKRKKTLKKKSKELSTLCDIPVNLICYDTEEDVDTWPENSDAVSQILLKYYSGREDMLPKILESKRDMSVYPSWVPDLDYLSDKSVECNLKYVKDTVTKIEEKELADQDEVDSDQEEDDDEVDNDHKEEDGAEVDTDETKDGEVDTDRKEDGLDSATTNDFEQSSSVPANSSTCTNSDHVDRGCEISYEAAGQEDFNKVERFHGPWLRASTRRRNVHPIQAWINEDFCKGDRARNLDGENVTTSMKDMGQRPRHKSD